MAPKTNAQRQADYRARLKRAAKVPPGDLEALADKAAPVADATATLKPLVEAMPEGSDKDAALSCVDDLQEVGLMLGRLKKAIRTADK